MIPHLGIHLHCIVEETTRHRGRVPHRKNHLVKTSIFSSPVMKTDSKKTTHHTVITCKTLTKTVFLGCPNRETPKGIGVVKFRKNVLLPSRTDGDIQRLRTHHPRYHLTTDCQLHRLVDEVRTSSVVGYAAGLIADWLNRRLSKRVIVVAPTPKPNWKRARELV